MSTESGHKAIENIEVGDKVWAYDEETGEQQLKEVVHLFRNTTDTWYHIEINNEKITCTKEHPYWIPNLKSWVNAGDLEVGMNVLLSNGNYGTINSVEVEYLETPETTYNFEVRDFHTYYVGQSNVLVHNTCADEFVNGEVFERSFNINGNTIDVLANTRIEGANLFLDDMIMYARGGDIANQLGVAGMRNIGTQINSLAAQQGFKSITYNFVRATNSSSALTGVAKSIFFNL